MIKGLIDEFKTSDLSKLRLKCEDFELLLEREKEVVYGGAVPMPEQAKNIAPAPALTSAKEEVCLRGHALVSPMVGTFYSAESPESKPFVEVGSKVRKGDVVAIIEAMKLMNEVEADRDGEVLQVLVKNGEMVEFNQPMFIIG